MKKFFHLSKIAFISMTFTATAAQADITSSFAAGVEGWSIVSFSNISTNSFSIVGTYAATLNASGGNPNGYISSTDPDGGDFTFSAPAAYLGSVASASGFSYDIVRTSGTTNIQTTDVMFVSGSTRLLWRSIPNLTPTRAWQSVALTFTPSANWRVGSSGGALASAADFQTVLGNLTGIYIRGEYGSGAENTGIDNVRLIGVSPVPEPGSLTLIALGLVPTLAFAMRRSRRNNAA